MILIQTMVQSCSISQCNARLYVLQVHTYVPLLVHMNISGVMPCKSFSFWVGKSFYTTLKIINGKEGKCLCTQVELRHCFYTCMWRSQIVSAYGLVVQAPANRILGGFYCRQSKLYGFHSFIFWYAGTPDPAGSVYAWISTTVLKSDDMFHLKLQRRISSPKRTSSCSWSFFCIAIWTSKASCRLRCLSAACWAAPPGWSMTSPGIEWKLCWWVSGGTSPLPGLSSGPSFALLQITMCKHSHP